MVPGSASYLLGGRISTWSEEMAEWAISEQKCVDPTPGICRTRTSTNDWKYIGELENSSVLYKLSFEEKRKEKFFPKNSRRVYFFAGTICFKYAFILLQDDALRN